MKYYFNLYNKNKNIYLNLTIKDRDMLDDIRKSLRGGNKNISYTYNESSIEESTEPSVTEQSNVLLEDTQTKTETDTDLHFKEDTIGLPLTDNDIKFLNDIHTIKDIKKIYNHLMNPSLGLYEYNQIPNIIDYESATSIINDNCHFGQRKLLLTEIEYYNMLDINKKYIIIYPGSASCEHLPVILQLFPNLKFLLIDPNFHSIDNKYSFKYIYQNTEVISGDNLRTFKSQLKSTGNKNDFFSKRNEHLKHTAELLLKVKFLNNDNKYNVLSLQENKENMKKIMDNYMHDSDQLITQMHTDPDRVFIIQDYMSIDLTKRIKKSYDMYRKSNNVKMCFLSDIRTSLFREHSPTDLDIVWNYALQIIFIKILKPKYSMTKFRPPWFNTSDEFGTEINKLFKSYDEGKPFENTKQKEITNIFSMFKKDFDFVKENYGIDMLDGLMNQKIYYFANDFIYTQAWSPPKSGETRVFVSKKNIDKIIIYDNFEWENKFYFLRFVRLFSYFDVFYNVLKYEKDNDYDGCYDCYRELLILGNHLLTKKHGKAKFEGVLDIDKIKKVIESDVQQIFDIYKLINRYVYYDLKPNIKCYFHKTMNRKMDYFVANFYGKDDQNPYIFGIKIHNNTEQISKNDVLYKYHYVKSKGMHDVMRQFRVDRTKNNLYLIKI